MENVPPSLNTNRPSQGPVDTSIKIRVVERLFICQLLLGKEGGVDSLAELFARFEVGHPLGRDVDRLARAWIAPHTRCPCRQDRKSTRLNSSHVAISYTVFCLQKNMIRPAYQASRVPRWLS